LFDHFGIALFSIETCSVFQSKPTVALSTSTSKQLKKNDYVAHPAPTRQPVPRSKQRTIRRSDFEVQLSIIESRFTRQMELMRKSLEDTRAAIQAENKLFQIGLASAIGDRFRLLGLPEREVTEFMIETHQLVAGGVRIPHPYSLTASSVSVPIRGSTRSATATHSAGSTLSSLVSAPSVDRVSSSVTSPVERVSSAVTSPVERVSSAVTSPVERVSSAATSPVERVSSAAATSHVERVPSRFTSPVERGSSAARVRSHITSSHERVRSHLTSPVERVHSRGRSHSRHSRHSYHAHHHKKRRFSSHHHQSSKHRLKRSRYRSDSSSSESSSDPSSSDSERVPYLSGPSHSPPRGRNFRNPEEHHLDRMLRLSSTKLYKLPRRYAAVKKIDFFRAVRILRHRDKDHRLWFWHFNIPGD
jgi:hypothetical protein